ncbi:hypothetical protein [Cohnella kolymensis]|nr:hypothetical protein [Cohnella kolymensis]
MSATNAWRLLSPDKQGRWLAGIIYAANFGEGACMAAIHPALPTGR